jgi:hypothetical protein
MKTLALTAAAVTAILTVGSQLLPAQIPIAANSAMPIEQTPPAADAFLAAPSADYAWAPVNYAGTDRSVHAGPASVIRFDETDPATLAALEEDLHVMSLLLEKNLARALANEGPDVKMGIPMLTRSGLRAPSGATYLEGFGALFTLRVGFPLLAPPAEPEKPNETAGGTDWEDAKKELYGAPEGRRIWLDRGDSASQVPYEEERVNTLKDEILKALKNAANIRGLKPEETVAVAVFGGTSGVAQKAIAGRRGANNRASKPATQTVLDSPYQNQFAETYVTPGPLSAVTERGTVLTFRIKKSDAEAFAKDQLSFDDFKKKAVVFAYQGNLQDRAAQFLRWSYDAKPATAGSKKSRY